MKLPKTITFVAGAAAAFAFSSCALTPKGPVGLNAYHNYDMPATLPTNQKNVRVKVSLSKQRTYVTEGSKVLLVMPVCVGTSKARTPSGNFTIFKKEQFKRANSHGYAYRGNQVEKCELSNKPPGWSFKGTPMPFWCEFKRDYGFHTGWVKHTPSSHGCIRMHENLAPKFFRLVKTGTPVNISYSQPEDSSVGNIALPPDAGPLPDYPGTTYTSDAYYKQYRAPKFQ